VQGVSNRYLIAVGLDEADIILCIATNLQLLKKAYFCYRANAGIK